MTFSHCGIERNVLGMPGASVEKWLSLSRWESVDLPSRSHILVNSCLVQDLFFIIKTFRN